ncbi:hypothetical protein TNCV_2956801 [Trichonephila clavipes]|nr:hypothetical protein TNCV_2956801 [Trichonephila clavipes]
MDNQNFRSESSKTCLECFWMRNYNSRNYFLPELSCGRGNLVIKVSDRSWHTTSSNSVPLKTRRVGERCTLNLSRAQTSSRWCGVIGEGVPAQVSSLLFAHDSKLRGKSKDDTDSIKITGFRIFMDSEIPSNKFTNSCELSDFLRKQPMVSKPTVSRLSLNVSSVKESTKERFLQHEDKNEAADSKFTMKVSLDPQRDYEDVTRAKILVGHHSFGPSFCNCSKNSLTTDLSVSQDSETLKKHLRIMNDKSDDIPVEVKKNSTSKCSQTESIFFWETSDFIKEFLDSTTSIDKLNVNPISPHFLFSNQFTQTDVIRKSNYSQMEYFPPFDKDESRDSTQIKEGIDVQNFIDNEIDYKTRIHDDDDMLIINDLQGRFVSPILKRRRVNKKRSESLIPDSTNEELLSNNFQETKENNVKREHLVTHDVKNRGKISAHSVDDFVLEEKYRRWNSFSESPEDLSDQPNQKFKTFHQESNNFSYPNHIIDKAFYEKELETIADSITHFPSHNVIISKKTFLPPLRILPKGIQLVSANVCYGSDIHKTEKASPLKITITCETSATTINIAPTFHNHLTINPTRIALLRNEPYKRIQNQIGTENKAENKIILNSFQKLNKDSNESNLVNEMASIKKTLHVTESVLFCRSSQTQLQCMNHVVIGLCDDCFMKTQKIIGEKIRTRTPLMTPETNDSFTSLYMEPLFYANDDKHFKSEEFIRSDDEEIDSSLKRYLNQQRSLLPQLGFGLTWKLLQRYLKQSPSSGIALAKCFI